MSAITAWLNMRVRGGQIPGPGGLSEIRMSEIRMQSPPTNKMLL